MLTRILERNVEIRTMARNSLPDPSSLDLEDLIEEVEELLNLMGKEMDLHEWNEEDVPGILKVRAVLTLLTEELRSYLVEAVSFNP